MNFQEQSQVFLTSRTTRRRSPIKPSTLSCYQSRINNHILPAIGTTDLVGFGNGAMKEFASGLSRKGLGPKTVLETVLLVQLIVGSALSLDGDRLYPRDWNFEFLDLPPVVGQKQPVLTPEQLKAALADKQYGLFYALLAGTGMRIGEALALRYGARGKKTGWDPISAVLDVRSSIWRGQEGLPKTLAGIRQIDLHPALNVALQEYVKDLGLSPTDEDFVFMTPAGNRLSESPVRKESLAPLGIEGFHAFRRFRVTHLRGQGVPEDLLRHWIGHADASITDKYSKLDQDIALRKTWAAKAGLGFEVPS